MSPGWNLFNSQDSRIASQARISTGRQRAEPPPLDYPHAATGSPDLGVNLPKTAGQKHKKYPRFQVEIGGISFHLFPQVAGGFAFLPYAATLCGTQRMEIRRFKITFRLFPLNSKKLSPVCFSLPQFAPVCPICIQSQKLSRIHGVKFRSRYFGSSEAFS